MKANGWYWLLPVAVAAGVMFLAWHEKGPRPVSGEEARETAERLLAREMTGPRYFSAPVTAIQEEGGPWIDVPDAVAQTQGVAAARGLTAGQIEELKKIATRLAEPHPSRVVGGGRINLNQLNLTIDSTFP